MSCGAVWSRPASEGEGTPLAARRTGQEPQQEQVISVRITSSVAVARGRKPNHVHKNKHQPPPSSIATEPSTIITSKFDEKQDETTIPPMLSGANIDFIKQLNSKKETRGLQNVERIHTFPSNIGNDYFNETDDSVAEPSVKSILELENKDEENGESEDDVPRARSLGLSPASNNYIQGLTHKPLGERGNSPRLTTVSFNIVHDTAKLAANYNSDPTNTFTVTPRPPFDEHKLYNEPPKFYNEPAKVYSQPAKVYSEPAKFYSEPAKIYSEPAKVYGEPARIYSEPAKIYSEPAKFYSQPASLHLPPVPPDYTPWQRAPALTSSTASTTPVTTISLPSKPSTERNQENQREKNYEVDEKISVMTDGRSHGVQESSTENCKQENCKVGYVVEGRQYRKYRVEERTSDGFIVGEYGVVRNEDGALRGVRYTADSDASPRLIYDALMKFLQLK